MKRWSVWLTSILVAALMIAGLCAIAVEYGSQSDPLVTLSYIEQVLLPQTQKSVDETVSGAKQDFEAALEKQSNSLETYLDKKLRSFAAGEVDDALIDEIAAAVVEQIGSGMSSSASWMTVEVPAGSTLVCDTGVQVVLCQGQAGCVADSSPGLLDLSNGETLENGKTLAADHLYAVTVPGRGIFTSQGCTLLVSGSYTLQ